MIAWTAAHITGAAEAMATAREFCGQPSAALEQYRQDNSLPKTDLETREAIGMTFADIWEQWRKDAKGSGLNLTPEQVEIREKILAAHPWMAVDR